MLPKPITVFTIGYTKKTAEEFFTLLGSNGVKRVIDVRLHNTSQLAGFSKRDDLKYFLRAILKIKYSEAPLLRPAESSFLAYRKKLISWTQYEKAFLHSMKERRAEAEIQPSFLNGGCLLCSEEKPDHCHRRLIVDYFQENWGRIMVEHL